MNYFKLILFIVSANLILTTIAQAETKKGYSYLDNDSTNTLKYTQLKDSEVFEKLLSCYDASQLNKYQTITEELNKQSSCFDKYGTKYEFQQKLKQANVSIQKLNLYKQIVELALIRVGTLETDLSGESAKNFGTIGFALIPKGELSKKTIDKYSDHVPLCKVNTSINTKNIVQSSKSNVVAISTFLENSDAQIARLKSNLDSIKTIFTKSNGKLGMIDSWKVLQKAYNLADDFVLVDTVGSELISTYQTTNIDEPIQLTDIVTFVSISIDDSKNVSINIKYPNGKQLENFDLPKIPLETFNKKILRKATPELKERLSDYKKMMGSFSNTSEILTSKFTAISNDSSCQILQNNSTDMQNSPITPLDMLTMPNYEFKEHTLISYSNRIIDRTSEGARYTYYSIMTAIKDLLSLNSSR